MGTRNLTAVYVDGEYKIAQYGQWDGYPEGQGLTALGFARDGMNEKLFREMLNEVRFLSAEEANAIYHKYGGSDHDIELSKYDVLKRENPGLSRDLGAKILYEVQAGRAKYLYNNIVFAADGLWCEWAYVIDLDKRTFEVFSGCSQAKLKPGERFYEFHDKEDGDYGGIHLVNAWNLDALPSDQDFLWAFGINRAEEI